MKKNLFFFLFLFNLPAFGNDCLQYKTVPNVSVKSPDWSIEVVQPLQEMDLLHGSVVATMSENYELSANKTKVEDGWCISLSSVDANIGYSDFLIKIDIRHVPNTCGYNATFAHENEHVRTYLSVIDDYNNYIHNSVKNAADSVMPVFVTDLNDADIAINELHDKLQSHPDLILMKQKISAEQEIRNKAVDHRDPGLRIKKCMKN